jgi:hypothetical protein
VREQAQGKSGKKSDQKERRSVRVYVSVGMQVRTSMGKHVAGAVTTSPFPRAG